MNNKTSSAQSGGTSYGNDAKNNKTLTGGARDVVFGDQHIHETKAESNPALHQIQPPPRDFTGRVSEINELLEMLEHGGVTISGLHGLGGVGKTTLALKLAELLEGRYPDAQFYLDLKGASEQPTSAADALAHVIRAYHPMAKLPESVAELRALYLSVLHNQKALLLMDNARDEHQVEPLIPPPGCLLLVTSRFHFTVPGLKVKNLEALLPEDALKLLLEIAPRIGGQAAEIARLCGNLPLGLRLAASFLSTRANFKVAEYVCKLSDATERLKLIEASLSLSYELLREELQANWRALAVFPDTFDQRAAAAVWDLDEEQTQERLGDLLAFSLVEWSEDTDQYRLHDLARVFAAARCSEAEALAHHQRHAEHFLQVLTEANRLYLQGGEAIKAGLALFDRGWSNAQAAWAWINVHTETIPRAMELCNEYPNANAYIADLRQHPRERIVWREAALAAAQTLGRKDTQSWHLSNLGVAYNHLGEYRRAIELYEQDLALAREIGDRSSEGHTLNNLGIAYFSLDETKLAIEFYEQSLTIKREIGDRRGEGITLNNLGEAYRNLGEPNRAIEFYEQSLPIKREMGDRGGEGTTLGNLGSAYYALGETRRALEFNAQRLAIAREIGDRSSEGAALWNTALALGILGDRAQAIALAEAALVIFEQIEHPDVATVRKYLAATPNKWAMLLGRIIRRVFFWVFGKEKVAKWMAGAMRSTASRPR